MGPDWTLQQRAFGGAVMSVSFLIFEFSTPMPSQTASRYRKHESCKKRAYEQRVREVEHGSFTPLVLSLTGGMGSSATVCYKRLASLIAQKRDQPYSSIMAWVRCCLNFALLRSSIQCIRGARSSIGQVGKDMLPPVDLVIAEANLSV